ncbi:MAG: hypothetical protein LIO58_03725 [Oscillospiraceae bacterium]|nr:hypothetical protein [Oscillospiraceae bacterium]
MEHTDNKTEQKPVKRPAERLTDWADGALLLACCAALVFLVCHNLGAERRPDDAPPSDAGVTFTMPNNLVIADGKTLDDGLQEYAMLYRDADGQYYIIAYDPISTDAMDAVS